jgi:hypothetical protein
MERRFVIADGFSNGWAVVAEVDATSVCGTPRATKAMARTMETGSST